MVSLPLESLSDRPFDRREVRVEVKLAWTVLDEVLDVSVGIVRIVVFIRVYLT